MSQKFEEQFTALGEKGLVEFLFRFSPGSGKAKKQMTEADSMLPVTMCTCILSSLDCCYLVV